MTNETPTDPWATVQRRTPYVTPDTEYSASYIEWELEPEGSYYDADEVDAAKAEVERRHAEELKAKDDENERLRAQLADIREACPSARVQYHAAKTTLELVQQEVSRGFNRDAELSQLRAQLAAAHGTLRGIAEMAKEGSAIWSVAMANIPADGGKPLTLKEPT